MAKILASVKDFGAKNKSKVVAALMVANMAATSAMCATETIADLAGKLDIVINVIWAIIAVVGVFNLGPGLLTLYKAITGGGQGQDSQAVSEGIKKVVGGLIAIFVPTIISTILGGDTLKLATSMFKKYKLIQ